MMKFLLSSVLLLFFSQGVLAETVPCSSEAVEQAKKLLTFHSDNDDRAAVESTVKQLPSIQNPVNKSQKFIVLEVKGYVYKAQYRMRLLYYPMEKSCTLMGQEILELANL